MANNKYVTIDTQSGLTLECSVRRDADYFYMDDADGMFKAMPLADVWALMTEDANFPGRYERVESRQVWIDGRYLIAVRSAASGIILGSNCMYILNDVEVNEAFIATMNKSYLESIGIMLCTITSFTAFGNKWFVSKDWGSDGNPGTFELPLATIRQAELMATDGGHDTIMVFPAATPYAEQLVLTKKYLSLIGSGKNCIIDPGAGLGTDMTLHVAAPGTCISGFESIIGRGYAAIHLMTGADSCTIERGIYRNDGTGDEGDGVVIGDAVNNTLIQDCSVSHCARQGIRQESPNPSHYTRILRVSVHENGEDGIHLDDIGGNGVVIAGCNIHNNGAGGVEGHGVHLAGHHNTCYGNIIKGNLDGEVNDIGVDNIVGGNGDEADIMEDGVTTGDFRRIVLAALAGDVTDAQTASPKFKSTDGLKTRITGLIDQYGNRSGTVRDGRL